MSDFGGMLYSPLNRTDSVLPLIPFLLTEHTLVWFTHCACVCEGNNSFRDQDTDIYIRTIAQVKYEAFELWVIVALNLQ